MGKEERLSIQYVYLQVWRDKNNSVAPFREDIQSVLFETSRPLLPLFFHVQWMHPQVLPVIAIPCQPHHAELQTSINSALGCKMVS